MKKDDRYKNIFSNVIVTIVNADELSVDYEKAETFMSYGAKPVKKTVMRTYTKSREIFLKNYQKIIE